MDIVLACIATFLLTIVAGFYQFGLDCCEHHATVRQCLIFVLLTAGAGTLAIFRTRPKRLGDREMIFAIGCLVLAALILTYTALPRLAFDYTNFDIIKTARIGNWQAGLRDGNSMTYADPPYGQIVGGWSGLNGTYTRSTSSPAELGMLKFFNKDSVTYTPVAPHLISVKDRYLPRPTDLARFKPVSPINYISANQTNPCNIELIDYRSASLITSVLKSEFMPVSGWSIMQRPYQLPDSVFLYMKNDSRHYIVPVVSGGERPDVSAHFKIPASLNGSGFHVTADLSDLTPGAYILSVLSVRGSERQICGDINMIVRD
jgi:hypothetical protein